MVGKLANAQLQYSPSGFMSAVSVIPTIWPRSFLFGHPTALFGPPRVPRSSGTPTHSSACSLLAVAKASPAIQPMLLMLAAAGDGTPKGSQGLITKYYCG